VFGALFSLIMIKKIVLLIVIATLASCNFFKEVEKPQDLSKELDLSQIDAYPQFDTCETAAKKCFYDNLAVTIQKQLDHLKLEDRLNFEMISLWIKIDTKGNFSLEKTENKTISNALKKQIQNRIKDLTPIAPATKQAIPVSSVYEVKVYLKAYLP
jgi:hypothetical protein